MSRPMKAMSEQSRAFELLQGGKLPEGVLKNILAELKKTSGAEMGEKMAMRQQAAKYLNQLSAPASAPAGTKAEEAISGLRAITDRIAKAKPAVEKELYVPPSAWGQYTMVFTPPSYINPNLGGLVDYTNGTVSSVTGNPATTAAGNETLGQMTCLVETNYDHPSGATASDYFGVSFKPLFPQATVRVTFDSQLFFWWYVNSIHGKECSSGGQGLIELYQYNGAIVEPPLQRGAFIGWGVVGLNSVDFDVVNEAGPTWYLEAPVVESPDFHYVIVVRLECNASGTGWPGGIAGAKAIVTIPSITVTVTAEGVPPNF